MSMTDPIGDMLTRIRNASAARHEKVLIPSSSLKVRIAEVMRDEGYIKEFLVHKDEVKQGAITGQKPVVTKARKSIANFKLRQGQSIGAMVTLRGDRAYEFLDRLVSIALPRVRDFKGVSPKAFDGKGNYTLGVKEQIIFPEINYDKVEKIKGLNITVVTTARNDEEGRALLRHLGMPFRP